MNTWNFILIFLMLIPGRISDRKTQGLTATTSDEARQHFDKGLLLLHNFEYPDAAEEFILAQQKDPAFTLAYWGEAMTYDHPLWDEVDVDKARGALKKMGDNPQARLASAKTDLEKDLIQGIEILFGKASRPDRKIAYADHMAELYKKYPDNHDVSAFYALSLLATKKSVSEWEDQNIKAAEITNAILKEDPNHPGAIHYLIHADDHPRYASNGLDAARKYATVASYSAHAKHMPSHIYLALGMWDDVIQSNEISWQASLDRKEQKNLNNDQLDYHTYKWLAYGYLQQGRLESARKIIEAQRKYVDELPSAEGRGHLLEMKGHYLFTTNEWNSKIADLKVSTDEMSAFGHFLGLYLDGYKWFARENKAELDNLIARFEKDLDKTTQLQRAGEGITICGMPGFFASKTPSAQEVTSGNRLLKRLKGLSAWLNQDMAAAESLIKETLPKEGAVAVGPPVTFISAYELYGKFLLADGRPAEAIQQFNKALLSMPNRHLATRLKLVAAKNLKDANAVTEVKKQLSEILKHGDPDAMRDL